MTTLLAILVAVAVIGQLALIMWLRHRASPDLTRVKIARLLEDAADRQCQHGLTQSAKLDAQQKGLGSDD